MEPLCEQKGLPATAGARCGAGMLREGSTSLINDTAMISFQLIQSWVIHWAREKLLPHRKAETRSEGTTKREGCQQYTEHL